MWIKELEIRNFQKHTKLNLKFCDKLNILHGDSDAGKSCILRAIKWVFFNDPKGDVVRKEGTKKTSVKVTLDTNVIVEKIKSNSVNAYVLYKEGEEKRFDAVGKTIPEEIKNALEVSTINVDKEDVILNIADQMSLPFLIGKSATFRSKLFNKLTGSDIIDKVFQSLNKDILRISRETKLETEHLKDQKKTLTEVTIQKRELENVYDNFKHQYAKVKELQVRYEQVGLFSERLKDIENTLTETINNLTNIKVIPNDLIIGLKHKRDTLEQYEILINKMNEINRELLQTKNDLKTLQIPNIDIDKLKNDNDKLKKLKELYSQVLEIEGHLELLGSDYDKYEVLILENEKKYKEILKQITICPFYKKECPLNKKDLE